MTDPTPATDVPRPTSPWRRLALFLSSPWTALVLLLVVFVHQTVGSALFFVRQWFEVNEMQWFNGWASALLWTLICICLALASLVRIPWRWSRFGAHLTHASLILLVITCAWYFAFKVEGDALLVRHYVEVTTSEGAARLLPNPGYKVTLGAADAHGHGEEATTAEVEMIMPRWNVLSSDQPAGAKPAGQTPSELAWAIMVKVSFPGGMPFTATLIEGHPELTQYTVQGRVPNSFLPQEFSAVTAEGDRVTASDPAGATLLSVELRAGAKVEVPVEGGVRSLEISKITKDFPLMSKGFEGKNGTMVEWKLKGLTGQQSGSSIVGQPTLTRFQQARVKQPIDPRLRAIRLVPAPEARAYHVDRPALWVRPADQPARRDPLQPMLSTAASERTALEIPDLPRYADYGTHRIGAAEEKERAKVADERRSRPLDLACGTAHGVRWQVTGFAPYAIGAERMIDDPNAREAPCLAVTLSHPDGEPLKSFPPRLATPEECLQRTIAWFRAEDDAQAERLVALLRERFPKLDKENDDPSGDDLQRGRLMFLTRPGGRMELWLGMPGANLQRHDIPMRTEVPLRWAASEVKVRVDGAYERPRRFIEPAPVPKEQQRSNSDVGKSMSWVQVTATTTGPDPSSRSTWVPYSHFPHVPRSMVMGSMDTHLGGGYASRPVTLTLPDGAAYEVLYSRMPMAEMPGDLWMTGFRVPRRPGSESPAEFFCHVGYAAPGTPIAEARDRATIHMNHPLAWRDTFFFQSGWDPQLQAFTVLGVGNRPAGNAMLIASILLALGMAWSGGASATGSTRGGAIAAGVLAAIFLALLAFARDEGYTGPSPVVPTAAGVAATTPSGAQP